MTCVNTQILFRGPTNSLMQETPCSSGSPQRSLALCWTPRPFNSHSHPRRSVSADGIPELIPAWVIRQQEPCLLASKAHRLIPAFTFAPHWSSGSLGAPGLHKLGHPSQPHREHPSPCPASDKHVRCTKLARIDSLHRINKAICCLGLVLL